MNKLKAVKQVLLNRPLIYNVEFEDATIKVSKNRYGRCRRRAQEKYRGLDKRKS